MCSGSGGMGKHGPGTVTNDASGGDIGIKRGAKSGAGYPTMFKMITIMSFTSRI